MGDSQIAHTMLPFCRLPNNFTHKEGAKRLDVFGRLLGLPHVLNNARKGVEFLANEPNYEFIVILVETMTGKPDIGG